MDRLTLNEFQQRVEELFHQSQSSYWGPLSILARLTEEVGELAEVVNPLHGEKRVKLSKAQPTREDEILELGDILFTLACYANSQNIDLDEALLASMKKVGKEIF